MTKEKLVKFLEALSNGEKEGDTFMVMTGKEGMKYSEYTSEEALFYISFDGSSLYHAFNHDDYPNPYERDNQWFKFCKANGIYGELGNAWNMSIYPLAKLA